MSLVPWLLNEFLEEHRRPSGDIFDQYFGLHHNPLAAVPEPRHLVLAPLRAGYVRPWRSAAASDSGVSSIKNDKDVFAVNLDVQQFRPEELKVKVEDGFLVVDAKHEERSDEHGFISRQFTRRYRIPEDVDPETLTSKLSSDGVLSLTAPKKAIEAKAREIPITHTNQPARIAGKKGDGDKMQS